jgi:hypothetical protein
MVIGFEAYNFKGTPIKMRISIHTPPKFHRNVKFGRSKRGGYGTYLSIRTRIYVKFGQPNNKSSK